MEDPLPFHHHHLQFPNDGGGDGGGGGLPIPPLDDEFPFFSENVDVTSDVDVNHDFPFNVDFDFTFDDISFADDLLAYPISDPEPDPVVLSSDIESDPVNTNSASDEVVRVYDSGPISSSESNYHHHRGGGGGVGKCESPEIGSCKSNSGVYSGNSCDRDVSSSAFLVANNCDDNNNNNNNSNNGGNREELGRKVGEIEHAKPRNETCSSGSGSDTGSKCVSKWKRKKEAEHDHGGETRVNKFRRSNSNANANASVNVNDENLEGGGSGGGSGGEEGYSVGGGGGGGDDDEKRKARLMRNRESAQLSRQRKKQYVEELEDKVRALHSTITDLNSKITYFMSENASLRHQLSGGGGGGGVATPGVPPPGMYPPQGLMPMPYPWMPCHPAYVVKNHGGYNVPCVPIPRLRPHQPAPAPKVRKSSEGKKDKGEGKTKKVASVSLLGLLFFMLLFGGLVPMVNVRYGRGGDGFGSVQKGAVFMVDKHMEKTGHGDGKFGHGRVLQQSSNSSGGNTSEPLIASLYVPRNDKLVKIDGNLIIHSVLASEKAMSSQSAEGPKTREETGLAIYPTPGPGSNNWRRPHLDRNQNGSPRALGSGSADFTPVGSDGKLQQWFREGLAGPMLSSGMCTEVFQFDVSPTPGSIVPATSVANITAKEALNSTHNRPRNRRILPGHAIPLTDHTLNSTGKHEQNDGLQSNKSGSSVVVSVLVDPREVGDDDGEGVMGSKTLSRIFVVVLIDSVKYVTYSCMLPFLGSGSHLITT